VSREVGPRRSESSVGSAQSTAGGQPHAAAAAALLQTQMASALAPGLARKVKKVSAESGAFAVRL